MHKDCARLLLYGAIGPESILSRLAAIFEDFEAGRAGKDALRRRILTEVKRLLDLATENGFDENLWHNYLTYLLISTENSFSLSCERAGALDGSINHFARADCAVFWRLFHFDFGPIEEALGLDCFTVLQDYRAIPKKAWRYNQAVSEAVRTLSRTLGAAEDGEEIFTILTEHYRRFGVGILGLNRAFRLHAEGESQALTFLPVHNADSLRLDDLHGYELQKQTLQENTEAFVAGRPANNVLLYGDSGTGKSTSIRALANEYYNAGLRMIELYKHQFRLLSPLIASLKNRNYRFVIFLDDLSFESGEVEYKFLKAVIEGGVEERPENVLIYATSNRRHLVRELWKDRDDMEFRGELHRSDTMEETLSLSSRFGVLIPFGVPSRAEYHEMVRVMAARQGLSVSEEELRAEANRWELRHGGVSGRTARQFINDLAGKGTTT